MDLRNLLQRIAIISVGLPLILGLLLIPAGHHAPFGVVLAVIAFQAGREYQHLLRQKWVTDYAAFFPWLCGLTTAMGWLEHATALPFFSWGMSLAFFGLFLPQMLRTNFFESLTTIAAYFLGLFLVANGLASLMALLSLPDGLYLIGILLASVWAGDIFAYLFGILIFADRRHKIPLKVSPAKSWEGYVGQLLGGVLGAIGAHILLSGSWSFAWGPFAAQAAPSPPPLATVPLLGLFITLFAALGDLAESVLKRSANQKDSGHILPGHGGILDRFDSLLFSAPALLGLAKVLRL